MGKQINLEAISLMQEGKFEEAYESFSKLAKTYPNNLEAIYFRAIIDFGHLKTHFDQTKEDFFLLANKKNPYQLPSIQLLTVIYDLDDDFDNVIIYGPKALELLEKSDNVIVELRLDMCYALARAYFHKFTSKELEKGLYYINKCFEYSEDAEMEYFLLKIDILVALKRYDEAKDTIAKAQSSFGNAGDLYYAKEKVSYSIALDKIAKEDESYKDDLNDALGYLDIYEKYSKNKYVIALTKVEIYSALKEYDTALSILDGLTDENNLESVAIEKIKIYESSCRIDEAIALCKNILETNDSWKIKYSLGYLLANDLKTVDQIKECLRLQYEAYTASQETFILYEICMLNNKLLKYEENYLLLKEHYKEGIPFNDGKGAYILAVMAQSSGKDYDEQVKYYYMAHERGYIDDVELLDEISGLVENPKSLEKMILKHQSDPLNTLDPWSKRKIGVRYLYGDDGYKQNFDKAIQYLTIADNELSDKACMKSTMGKYYEFTGDYNLAFNAYEKAYDIYVNDLFNPCNCSVGYLAHAYYNGIGVEKNVDYAKELVLSGINKLGINCSNSVIYLYAYFALKGEKDFDLNQAAKLLSSTHTFDRYEISKFVMLRQIYLKLGKNTKDVDLYIKRCLKFASKSATKYYKENIKKEVSYPYFGDF